MLLLAAAGTYAALASPAAANTVPEAEDDIYRFSSIAGPTHTVPAPGVLGNDTDPDGDPLTAELLSGTTYGTLDFNSDGSFTYTPTPGFAGVDSFDYYARDTPFTVSPCCTHVYLLVTRAPVAEDDAYGAVSGVPRRVFMPGVLANDQGGDRARLASQPAYGTVGLHTSGRFTYTSDPGFTGTDTFTYEAIVEGEPPSQATVTMTVKATNRRPRGQPDSYTTPEDTPLFIAAPGVLANDTDADADPLKAVLVSSPYGDDFFMNPDGSFEYYPPSNFDSPVSFTYRVDDGITLSAPVTATIEIPAVSDPPTAEEDFYYLSGATTLNVPAPGVLGNDFDEVEGDALFAHLRNKRPVKGTVDLNLNGSFTYTRTPGMTGYDRFRYQVKDSGGAWGNITIVHIYP